MCLTVVTPACATLCQTPNARVKQSTSAPPGTLGQSFTANVIKHSHQLMLVVRETNVDTFTLLLEDEHQQT